MLGKAFLLAAIHLSLSLLWLFGLVLMVAALRALLKRPSVTGWLDALTGTLLVALGLRLAFVTRGS